jgi:hypothetical protein
MKKLFDNNINKQYAVCKYAKALFTGTLDECWEYMIEHYGAYTMAQLNELNIKVIKHHEHTKTLSDWS